MKLSGHGNANRITVLTLLSTTLFSMPLFAGQTMSYPVRIDQTNRYANGDLSTTRALVDSKSRIGCTVNSENSVTCTAVTANGTTATCGKYQASQSMVNAVMHLASDGYVYFQWDTSGNCTYVLTEKASTWAPKH